MRSIVIIGAQRRAHRAPVAPYHSPTRRATGECTTGDPLADPTQGPREGGPGGTPPGGGPGGRPRGGARECTFRRVFNNSPSRDRFFVSVFPFLHPGGVPGKSGFFPAGGARARARAHPPARHPLPVPPLTAVRRMHFATKLRGSAHLRSVQLLLAATPRARSDRLRYYIPRKLRQQRRTE